MIRRVLILLWLLMLVPTAWADMATDEEAVRATVDRYAAAMVAGDLAGLQGAFLAHGAFVSVKKAPDGSQVITTQRFDEVLPTWVARPFPQAHFTYAQVRIIEGRLALVEGTLDLGPVRFADFLNLYKLNGAWVISAKTTTTLPKSP